MAGSLDLAESASALTELSNRIVRRSRHLWSQFTPLLRRTNIVVAILIAAGLADVLLISLLYQTSAIESRAASIEDMALADKANRDVLAIRTAGLDFFAKTPFEAEATLCAREHPHPYCEAFKTQSIEALGAHSDIWVSLDAVYEIGKTKSLDALRAQNLLLRLAAALGEFGALEAPATGDTAPSNALSSALAMVAVGCAAQHQSPICQDGLPPRVKTALTNIAAFVTNRTREFAYLLSNRALSATRLYTLLVSEGPI